MNKSNDEVKLKRKKKLITVFHKTRMSLVALFLQGTAK